MSLSLSLSSLLLLGWVLTSLFWLPTGVGLGRGDYTTEQGSEDSTEWPINCGFANGGHNYQSRLRRGEPSWSSPQVRSLIRNSVRPFLPEAARTTMIDPFR